MITVQDVAKCEEVKALVEGSQKHLDALRLYRTFCKTYKHSF